MHWQYLVEKYLINNGYNFFDSDNSRVWFEIEGSIFSINEWGIVRSNSKDKGSIETFLFSKDFQKHCPGIIQVNVDTFTKIKYDGNLKILKKYKIPYKRLKTEKNIILVGMYAAEAIKEDICYDSFPAGFNLSLTIMPDTI